MHFSTASTIITFALAALTPLASAQAPNLDARDLAGLHQRGLDNLYERDVAALEALHKREFNVIDALYERDLENVHERDLLQPMSKRSAQADTLFKRLSCPSNTPCDTDEDCWEHNCMSCNNFQHPKRCTGNLGRRPPMRKGH